MDLYLQVSLASSKLLTKAYSTSFSLGIRTLDEKVHDPIYAIYGFVRLADEIVDTFHDQDKAALLQRFREDTYRAIEEKISLNPILHSFQWAVNKFGMERELIDAFLYSMELDLTKRDYNPEEYKQYIYGSAEVVGLMCLRVFCEDNPAAYESLREDACALGSAFQKSTSFVTFGLIMTSVVGFIFRVSILPLSLMRRKKKSKQIFNWISMPVYAVFTTCQPSLAKAVC